MHTNRFHMSENALDIVVKIIKYLQSPFAFDMLLRLLIIWIQSPLRFDLLPWLSIIFNLSSSWFVSKVFNLTFCLTYMLPGLWIIFNLWFLFDLLPRLPRLSIIFNPPSSLSCCHGLQDLWSSPLLLDLLPHGCQLSSIFPSLWICCLWLMSIKFDLRSSSLICWPRMMLSLCPVLQ